MLIILLSFSANIKVKNIDIYFHSWQNNSINRNNVKGLIMNEEEFMKIEELTLYMYMDLNILHHALKYNDNEIDTGAINHSVEKLYKISTEIRDFF